MTRHIIQHITNDDGHTVVAVTRYDVDGNLLVRTRYTETSTKAEVWSTAFDDPGRALQGMDDEIEGWLAQPHAREISTTEYADTVAGWFPEIHTSRDGSRGRGRPAVGDRVELRLPPELINQLDERAEKLGKTRSGLARDLIARSLYHRLDTLGPI